MSAELLVATVARHFEGAQIQGSRIALGIDDLALDCRLGTVQPLFGGVHSVQLLMTLSGGPWQTPVELASNAYAASVDEAIVSGACAWTCTFAAVLLAALGSDDVPERVSVFDIEVAGVPMQAFVDTFDTVLHFAPGGEAPHDARARLDASPCLAPALLESLDERPVRDLMIASVYVGELPDQRIVELRLDGEPFQFDDGMFEDVAPQPAPQMVSLRELALLVRATPDATS